MKKLVLLFIILLIGKTVTVYGQTDTAFWFAAPEVDEIPYQGFNQDRPIVLNISTYGKAAIVTVSQPANGGMPIRVKSIPANASDSIDLTAWIDLIECKPANTILNKGLKISSTVPISVYYEVNANHTNPDLFALKGKNSLGKDFWISSQNILDNSAGQYSSFNIVATENNTTVTINPSKDIVGHVAGSPFNTVLNKGQTYAAIADRKSVV